MVRKQKIRFTQSKDYKRVHASGFFGGVSPTGHLQFDVYEEFRNSPETITIEIDEKTGEVVNEIANPKEPEVNRLKHVGVTIPIDTIPGIIEWLNRKLEEYETIQKEMRK